MVMSYALTADAETAGIEEIRKMKPKERIRKLRELEESRKKEIEEARDLMRDSMREIGEASESRHAPISQVKAQDISQLLTIEEKRVFRTARFQEPGETESLSPEEPQALEEVADKEARDRQPQDSKPIYGQAVDEARKGVDYGARAAAGENPESGPRETYSGQPGRAGIQSAYAKDQETGDASDGYMRRKQEEQEKIRRESAP